MRATTDFPPSAVDNRRGGPKGPPLFVGAKRRDATNGFATFSPPVKATAVRDSLPRILIAIGVSDDITYVAAVNGDGVIELLGIGEVLVDWRYDPKTELWSDESTGATETPFGDSDA